MKVLSPLIISIVIIIMCVKCNGSPSSQDDFQQTKARIKQRIKTYFSHMTSGRFDKAWEMCTEEGRDWLRKEQYVEAMHRMWIRPSTLDKIHSVKVLRVDYAEVIVTFSVGIPEIQRGKRWRLKVKMIFKADDWYIGGKTPVVDEQSLTGEKFPTLGEIKAIGDAQEKRGLPILKKVIETHKNAEFRYHAAVALGKLQPPYKDLLPILLKVCKEELDERVKARVVGALGLTKKKEVIPIIISCLDDKSPVVRRDAGCSFDFLTPKAAEISSGYTDISYWQDEIKKAKTPEERNELEKKIQDRGKELKEQAQQVKAECEQWWQENKDYLYWDGYGFRVDKEAKKNKTPIDPDTKESLTEEELKKWREEEKEIEKVRRELEKAIQQQPDQTENKNNQ